MKKKDKIQTTQRPSAWATLSDFCTFSMHKKERASDYMEVTQWSNWEGYDVRVHDVNGERHFALTWGQMQALKACIKKLEQ